MIKIIGLSVILLILISFHSIQSHAAYFYLADNEPTCFVEDGMLPIFYTMIFTFCHCFIVISL